MLWLFSARSGNCHLEGWQISLSIGLVSSQMIGAWGNFFSREFIGTSTDSIFAMQIPVETVGSMRTDIRDAETSGQRPEMLPAVQVHPLWFL